MNCLDCCSSIKGCDCCESLNDWDCCESLNDWDCCPDCYGAGSLFGGIKFGKGLSLDGDTLNVTIVGGSDYVLPTASESVKGRIKVGHSLKMIDEVMNVALDTIPSTVEGFMWIASSDEQQSIVAPEPEPDPDANFNQFDVDDVFTYDAYDHFTQSDVDDMFSHDEYQPSEEYDHFTQRDVDDIFA